MIRLIWEKISNFFSTEVPADMAACEFDCRESECINQKFLNCSRRLEKEEALNKLSESNITKDFPKSE